MEILGIPFARFLVVFLSAIFIAKRMYRFLRKEKGQTVFKLSATVFVWGAILIFSLFPGFARSLSLKFGLGEGFATLIFIAFIAVFLIIFRLLAIIENLERHITEIVRSEAIKELRSNQKK